MNFQPPLSSKNELPDEEDRDFIRALARGLKVIECFEGVQNPMGLSEVAARVGLSRGSTRRVLITLRTLGYVTERRGAFALAPHILRLGYSYLSSQPVWTHAQPYAESVLLETGETCSLAVLDGDEIVYILRATGQRILNNYLTVGTRLPAHAASMGRVLLAGLSDAELERFLRLTPLRKLTAYTVTDPAKLRDIIAAVRRDGYAINEQEMEVGLRSIAVPIQGADGQVIAALNVSCSSARTAFEQLERDFLPVLRRAAREISDLCLRVGMRRQDG